MGDQKFIGKWQEKLVNLGATNDENFWADEPNFLQVLRLVNNVRTLCRPVGITGEDNALPVGKWLTNGVPGFTPHDDRVSCGVALEELEVLREIPGQATFFADDPLRGHGNNGGEFESLFQEMNWMSLAGGWGLFV